jgi:hypothetical protein
MLEEILQFWKNCWNGMPLPKREKKKLTHEERVESRRKRRDYEKEKGGNRHE